MYNDMYFDTTTVVVCAVITLTITARPMRAMSALQERDMMAERVREWVWERKRDTCIGYVSHDKKKKNRMLNAIQSAWTLAKHTACTDVRARQPYHLACTLAECARLSCQWETHTGCGLAILGQVFTSVERTGAKCLGCAGFRGVLIGSRARVSELNERVLQSVVVGLLHAG